MIRGAAPYTPCVYVPAAGLVPITGLTGYNVTGCEHEHAMPGGPINGRFAIQGGYDVPLGAQYVAYSGSVPVFTGNVGAYDTIGRGRSRQTIVTLRGTTQHLQDDNVYSKMWVRYGFAGWVDSRQLPNQTSQFQGGGEVNADYGPLVLRFPQGIVISVNHRTGISLDAGPGNTIKSIYVDFTVVEGVDAAAHMEVASSVDGIALLEETQLDAAGFTAALNKTTTVTFATARRYAHIHFLRAAGITYGTNLVLRINDIRVYTASTYHSAGASILTGDIPMKELVAAGVTPHLSTSTAGIATLPTPLTNLGTDGSVSPYDVVELANGRDGYQWYADPSQALPPLVVRATPDGCKWVAPPGTYQLPEGAGFDVSDLYSKVVVRYQTASGVESSTTITATASDILTRAGLTRTATIEVQRPCNSAEATAIGNAFLAAYSQPSLRAGSIRLHQGFVVGRDSGVEMPAARLFVGDRLELPGERNPGGTIGYRGMIQNVHWLQDEGACEVTLESDRAAWDRMFARFNAGTPWSALARAA